MPTSPARTVDHSSTTVDHFSNNILSVTLIGPLTVRRGATMLDAHHLGGPKPRQILEILLMQVGVPVSKNRLIDLLWGANPPREALTSIESYVSVLRRHLQPGSGKAGPLRTTTGGYVIDAASVDLDVANFDRLVREAGHLDAAGAYPLLVQALSLATGPLLGDELRPTWAEEERHRHAVAVTNCRVMAAEMASELGQPEAAVDWAKQALADDRLNERAWTALILGLEQSGRHAEGLRAYAECRTVLDEELGCEPSITLRKAHVRLLDETAGGQDDLSEAVSALLVLSTRLPGNGHATAGSSAKTATQHTLEAVRQAENVLTTFLRRVLEAA
jgi:DNA-binding SARP family transcriptional activator